MSRRERKRQARIDEILEAGLATVRAEGLGALTIAGLADDLDVAVGKIYYYFANKGALVAALQVRAIERLDARLLELEDRVATARGGARPLALAAVLAFPLGYLHHTRHAEHRLIDGVLSAPDPQFDDALAAETERALTPVLARCAAALDAAVDAAALDKDAALPRAHGLWALAHGLEHFPKRDRLVPARLRAEALTRVLLEGLLQGWGAQRADLRTAWRIVGTALPK